MSDIISTPVQEGSTPTAAKSAGITGGTLKIIAIVTMFIDHFAAILLADIVKYRYQTLYMNDASLITKDPVYITMSIMRIIGRLAFPIFCFLVVEGFLHTRSKLKYAARMFVFALISEFPFDYAFNGGSLEFTYQNVFFTLFLGLVLLILFEQVQQRFTVGSWQQTFLQFLLLLMGMFVASLLKADYGYMGVVTIFLMYCFRRDRVKETIVGCLILTISSLVEVFAFAIVPLVKRYNGQRGLHLKYFFYFFYPCHLVLIALLSHFLGYR